MKAVTIRYVRWYKNSECTYGNDMTRMHLCSTHDIDSAKGNKLIRSDIYMIMNIMFIAIYVKI